MKKIGVFTSGGDSPGMNACIRSVVRTACQNGVEVIGIMEGFQGMIENKFIELKINDVANIIQRGGTILQSSRSQDFRTKAGREKAYQNLEKKGIEGIICIGGDGSYTACKVFFEEFGIPAIGCPGTIDNDIFGTDFTIGFDTAVNTVIDAVDKIRDTAESHRNVFFVEVMGRHSGNIALFSGISAGAESIMLPEVEGEFDTLLEKFKDQDKRKKQFSIIIVAEGDEEGNALSIAARFKNELPDFDPKVTVLGHIQRGGAPTANDRILASRVGNAAVELILKGNKNIAVGIVNQKIQLTTFEEATSHKKSINQDFIRLSEILSA